MTAIELLPLREVGRVFNFLSALFKLAVVSLLTGAVLSAMNLSAEAILARVGLTPDNLLALLERGVQWAIPNIILGSMVILPVWAVLYLLRPPRGWPRNAACSSMMRCASRRLLAIEAMMMPTATTAINSVQTALISGVTPSRTWL